MANHRYSRPTEAQVTVAIPERDTSRPTPGVSTHQVLPERLLYTVGETKQLLGGLSHSWFYTLVKLGKIRLIKLGRRSYVHASEISRVARGEVRVEEGSKEDASPE